MKLFLIVLNSSNQNNDQVAADAALEDCLYYMEKALLSGSLSKDDFLKVTINYNFFIIVNILILNNIYKTYRQLAREQFMKRATMKKVHEVQRAMKSQ